MVTQVENLFLDSGLIAAQAALSQISVCAAEPTTFTLASDGNANCLGFFSFGTSAAFTGPSAGTSPTGRKLVANSVSSGTIKTTNTASWWAAIGTASLYAHGLLSSAQAVTAGNTFTLGSFEIRIANQ